MYNSPFIDLSPVRAIEHYNKAELVNQYIIMMKIL